MNQGYSVVGVQLSNGNNMTIDEYKRSRGEIDYSFSTLKEAVDKIRDIAVFKHCVYIDIHNPKLFVAIVFSKDKDYIRFELCGEGSLKYSNNNETKTIENWDSLSLDLLAERYNKLTPVINTQSVVIPKEVMHGMFTDLKLVLGQYKNKCELQKLNTF